MMAIRFTDIPEKMSYPANYKATISTIHSAIIEQVTGKYRGTFKEKNKIASAMNAWAYWIIDNNSRPKLDSDLVGNYPEIDDDECRQVLGSLYLMPKNISWNIEVSEESKPVTLNTAEPVSKVTQMKVDVFTAADEPIVINPTAKEDLYIRPPVIPRFDTKSVYISGQTSDGLELVIYRSLPVIPTKQNEISVSTDVSKMTSQDLKRLYPNVFIPTRSQVMYTPVEGLNYHKQLGVILQIEGFTEAEVVENIIKYPHLFKLYREVDGQLFSFYSSIEVDGELHKISDYWARLPESKVIPFNTEFVKEYVVRRYLLERDIKGVKHKYPLYGTLEPFLTLFTTPEDYISWGYTDVEGLSVQCVKSRVSYKQSRNPILRRLKNE